MFSLNTKSLFIGILSCFLLFISQVSIAVSVLPGTSSLLGGTTVADNPDLGGTVIRDQLIPFQIADSLGNVILTGNVQDRVVRSTNAGEFIFAPRLRDLSNPGSDAWITGFEMVGFGGFSTDVDYRTDGLGNLGPNEVTRSGDGSSLEYRYDSSLILPPNEGYFLSVLTDAAGFDLSGGFTIYAQNDFGADIFSTSLQNVSAPAVVPVPPAVWLLGSGLIGLLGVGRQQV